MKIKALNEEALRYQDLRGITGKKHLQEAAKYLEDAKTIIEKRIRIPGIIYGPSKKTFTDN